ncbi:MAG: DegT/DnrJ/EryC1/StrS family aminotransferase [Bacteroidetes bacterium]|nr:DegT/DnrJ/EryC1/StrS family aminotransferase [Bacteroidota bacterium]
MIEYENLAKANQKFFAEYEKDFKDTLQGGWFILGSKVQKFENSFADYNNSNFCIGMASGLDALTLSLTACQFQPGDEILVPSNTYIATILSILQCKLTPVLVEPDIRTYNIDPSKLEDHISPHTRAIVPVHLYGKSCDMDPILSSAKKHNLIIIEDCAQAHGAKYRGKKVGTFGEYGAFSFYPTKNLGCLGDGGAVLVQTQERNSVLRKLRNYGSEKKYYNDLVGFNSRLDEVQAGFLSIKLKYLDEINEHKRQLAQLYHDGLKEDFVKPSVQPGLYDVYHIYNIRHEKRDKLKDHLFSKGIKTDIHYPVAPHKQKAMEGIIKGSPFPVSEEIHKTTLSLPISFFHTKQDIEKVIEAANKF